MYDQDNGKQDRIERGMKIYEETRRKQNEAKTLVKEEKRKEREARKKPAFVVI